MIFHLIKIGSHPIFTSLPCQGISLQQAGVVFVVDVLALLFYFLKCQLNCHSACWCTGLTQQSSADLSSTFPPLLQSLGISTAASSTQPKCPGL